MQKRPEHGYEIARAIKRMSPGVLDFREAALYPVLHAMEGSGYLEAYLAAERSRIRRYYRITSRGRRALRRRWSDPVSSAIPILEGCR